MCHLLILIVAVLRVWAIIEVWLLNLHLRGWQTPRLLFFFLMAIAATALRSAWFMGSVGVLCVSCVWPSRIRYMLQVYRSIRFLSTRCWRLMIISWALTLLTMLWPIWFWFSVWPSRPLAVHLTHLLLLRKPVVLLFTAILNIILHIWIIIHASHHLIWVHHIIWGWLILLRVLRIVNWLTIRNHSDAKLWVMLWYVSDNGTRIVQMIAIVPLKIVTHFK